MSNPEYRRYRVNKKHVVVGAQESPNVTGIRYDRKCVTAGGVVVPGDIIHQMGQEDIYRTNEGVRIENYLTGRVVLAFTQPVEVQIYYKVSGSIEWEGITDWSEKALHHEVFFPLRGLNSLYEFEVHYRNESLEEQAHRIEYFRTEDRITFQSPIEVFNFSFRTGISVSFLPMRFPMHDARHDVDPPVPVYPEPSVASTLTPSTPTAIPRYMNGMLGTSTIDIT